MDNKQKVDLVNAILKSHIIKYGEDEFSFCIGSRRIIDVNLSDETVELVGTQKNSFKLSNDEVKQMSNLSQPYHNPKAVYNTKIINEKKVNDIKKCTKINFGRFNDE